MTAPGRDGGLGLEYLSVFGMPLPDYVALAARLGCDFVSVNYGRPANAPADHGGETLRESAALRKDLAEAVAGHGLRIELVEGFAIVPNAGIERYAADLDAIARLGARSICAVGMDRDLGRTRAQFAALADMASERGLRVTTEVGAGTIRTFEKARALWQAVAHPGFALLIDTMHFFRFGGRATDLDTLPPGAVGHVQLCDVPMPARIESYMEEALFERRAPGEGDLPLGPFLARLPASVPIGLEVPIRSEADAGIDAETRLGRCLARTRALIADPA